VPAGTIAAFAITDPSSEFSVDTSGCNWPAFTLQPKVRIALIPNVW